MPKHLTKESEKRLLDGLEKVSSLIGAGTHPNDAIVKIASEMKIPAGHVRLMVNAVNTGQTNAHRGSVDDPIEKAAEFPLASADAILERIFPDTVKTAAASYLESVVAPDYSRGPAWVKEHARIKVAKAPIDFKMTDKKPVVERDPTYEVKKAVAHVQRNMHAVNAASMKVAAVRQQAVKLAEELKTYFKRPESIAYDSVKANCELMFGPAATVILKTAAPAKPDRTKKASNYVDITAVPYSLVKKAIELAAEFTASQEAYKAAVKTANDDSERLLSPFVPSPSAGTSVMADLLSKTDNGSVKNAFLGGAIRSGFGLTAGMDIAKDVAKKLPGLQPSSDLERKDYMSLLDPGHEAEIRNIQSEALLNDLMANDDVIRGYDPEEVIDAYNEVSQIAPYAANKKAIMRDLMRKRLSGGGSALDQFTVGDTINTQQKMRDLETVKPESLNTQLQPGATGAPQSTSVLGR